jgi:hypothetical protein
MTKDKTFVVIFQMFVGQVPRSMDENDLRIMFEEFGRVHQINVLRDKITGASKGGLTHIHSLPKTKGLQFNCQFAVLMQFEYS